MRIKLSEFRKLINKFLAEALEEDMEKESVDRLNRHERGYDDSEFDESVDRLNRHKLGYGDSEFDEAAAPPAAPQSAKVKVRDKSQMQGVGPRPNMSNAFGDEQQPKKEAAEDEWLSDKDGGFDRMVQVAKEKDKSADDAEQAKAAEYMAKSKAKFAANNKGVLFADKPKKEAADDGVQERGIDLLRKLAKQQNAPKKETLSQSDPTRPPQSASNSAALHTRDKSQMKGVGPRPTMDKAFEPIGQKKEEQDPNKTAELPSDDSPDSFKAEKEFNKQQKAKQSAANKDHIKNTVAPNAFRGMNNDGHKFSMDRTGNKYFTTKAGQQKTKEESAAPSDEEDSFIKSNKADYQKRYGARWKDALYGAASKKFKK